MLQKRNTRVEKQRAELYVCLCVTVWEGEREKEMKPIESHKYTHRFVNARRQRIYFLRIASGSQPIIWK